LQEEVAMSTRRALRTLIAPSTLVGILLAITACGGNAADTSEQPATKQGSSTVTESSDQSADHQVEVRLQGVAGAQGEFIAGVLMRGDKPYAKYAVGGFRPLEANDDPFSAVAVVADEPPWPPPGTESSAGDPLAVSPGRYTLLMWRGPTLTPYSNWAPAREPGLTGCPVRFEVGDAAVTTVTVTGFPNQGKAPRLETLRPCLQ
jgi:hypothetical protein